MKIWFQDQFRRFTSFIKFSDSIILHFKKIYFDFKKNFRKKMVQNQSRIPKCFYESILSGLEWNFSVTARNVVFDSWYIRSFEVSNRTSMAWIWIGSQNEAFYCTELSSFKLIADLAFCRSKVAAIGSTWSKVDDVLVEAVDERYSLANISSTFHRPPQSSREPYLKNELFDKTKLKNARFIKFIFFIFYFRRSHFVLK